MSDEALEPLTPEEEAQQAPQERRVIGSMGFLDHLDELRKVIFRCVLSLAISLVVTLVFLGSVMDYLQYPFRMAMDEGAPIRLVTNSPLAVFTVVVQVAFLVSFILALPFLLTFIAGFVSPALVQREKRLLRPVCLGAIALFLMGAAFAFYLIVPSTIRFSIALNRQFDYDMVWTADRYYSMLVWMVLSMGAAFQFPLVILLFVKLGFVNSAKLASWWRIAVVVIFIVAAILTPTPDPLTQALVALPLCGLYFLSIILARFVEKKDAEEVVG